MVKVSIILPIYNNANDAINAINSVLKQTYKDWELIIINDSSKDNIKNVLKRYDKYKNIKIYHNLKNMGCYWCLNFGIQNSTGEYITRIDSDDKYNKNKIRKQVRFLDNNTNYLGIFVQSIKNMDINHKIPASMAPFMMRRNIINDIGYYDSVRFGADLEYKRRLFLYYGKEKFKFLKMVMYYIKKRPNSLTKHKNSKMFSPQREMYNKEFNKWHKQSNKNNLYISFPLETRPFPIHKLSMI